MTKTQGKAAAAAVSGAQAAGLPAHGAVIDIPLDRLKASPRNARRTPHGAAFIAQLAASIAARGMLQKPVVEPERDAAGEPTGCWLVTIGEGRRQAMRLRAQRKEIGKRAPVSCVVDLANDAHEISLDENVTRADMHPADQFEAFRELAERRGLSAEEIGARFGVTAPVVRQRLRLAAAAPELMAAYRAADLTLDQLMAFALTEDHERQRQVLERLPPWNRHPGTIRRLITEEKAPADDRRVVFVGVEAYEAAGGTVLRDLFTDDRGGWLDDVVLLDRLVMKKLAAEAEAVRAAEGWLWAEACLDYPHGHGLRRLYPQRVERPEEDLARIEALRAEYEAAAAPWDAVEDLPAGVEARLSEIEQELAAFGDDHAYAAEDKARAGVFVVLGFDGAVRLERGFVRKEDEAPDAEDDAPGGKAAPQAAEGPEPEETEAPLSERLVLDLTACRTVGLQDALASRPDLALVCVTHALALQVFYRTYGHETPLDIRASQPSLRGLTSGLDETPAARRIAERHESWGSRLPRDASEMFEAVAGLGADDLMGLLAHCASLTLSAVRNAADRRPSAWALADRLASLTGLDMAREWAPTVASYLGRVTKGRILEAVGEASGEEAAGRIEGLKKAEMAEHAEALLAGTGWLPALLRTSSPEQAEDLQAPADGTAEPGAEATVLAAE